MIDIHAHILPGLDDGAASMDEALAMARKAAAENIHHIIATPHCMDGVYNCTAPGILEACARLNTALSVAGIPLTIHPGAEVRVTHDTLQAWDAGHLLSLGNTGTHILLELPGMFITDGIIRTIRQLSNRGLTTVLAHPERNPMIMHNPAIIREFVFEGALVQITASSLIGDMGRGVRKTTEKLMDMDAVHFVASDIHPGRKYNMTRAAKKLTAETGNLAAREILTGPEIILVPPNCRTMGKN
ncbi:MAG: CpsB/CapC family capsule biosynthesis tyrosine phosphatase [Pseudomonadota bacterium]